MTDFQHIPHTHNKLYSSCTTFPMGKRLISTPRLHTLLRFHLVPINLIISQET